jgi:tetratricopeptide (TPR) repeat protein
MSVTGQYYWTLGSLYAQFGQIDPAINCYRHALYAFRQAKDALNMGRMLNRLGELHARRGDQKETQALCQAAARTFRRLNNIQEAIPALRNIAMVHYHQARPLLALKLLEKTLDYCEDIGDTFNAAMTLSCMAHVYETQQQYLFALASDEAALDIFRNIEHIDQLDQAAYHTTQILCHLGHLCKQTGHLDVALHHYLEALNLLEALDYNQDIPAVHEPPGRTARSPGQCHPGPALLSEISRMSRENDRR